MYVNHVYHFGNYPGIPNSNKNISETEDFSSKLRAAEKKKSSVPKDKVLSDDDYKYLAWKYSRGNVELSKQSIFHESSSVSSNGNYHGTLKMGYLHSEFSPVSGQELHMKYDESSTDEDPVMLVEGRDLQGKTFTQKIHLNHIDAQNATPAQMTALRVHLAQLGDKSVKASSGIPLKALSSFQDVNTAMNFQQYYNNWGSLVYEPRTAETSYQAELYKNIASILEEMEKRQ